MSDNPEEKEQYCKIQIENQSKKTIVFGLEPEGWYSDIKPEEFFEVFFTKEKHLAEFDLTVDKWGSEGVYEELFTITSYLPWWAYVYLDEMLLSHSNGPEKNELNISDNDIKTEYKFRIVNKCENEVTFGIEPLGLLYGIPSKSRLDITFFQKGNDDLTLLVGDNSTLILYSMSIDVTVYIDGEICNP